MGALARSGASSALVDRAPAHAWRPIGPAGGRPVWRLRPAAAADQPFLERMLHATANWDPTPPFRSLADVLGDPASAAYLDGWGRPGDAGVVAEDGGGRPIGAAWYRLFPASEPGHGYVDAATPEMAIAVDAEHRGRGIGAALMDALAGRALAAGLCALSLSVALANSRAIALYERHGFRRVAVEGRSLTMRARLDVRWWRPSGSERGA
jgi:ribosomal protein S18 acetylase RimI-like enzyme